MALLLAATAFGEVRGRMASAEDSPQQKETVRNQLAIGYSLLYQRVDGIPRLKWVLMFKRQTPQMQQVTDDLIGYYKRLAASLEDLSKKYPAVRIDLSVEPEIEADARTAIGMDLAKDVAPLAGKAGIRFEREVLLTLYSALNEQRHLVGIMQQRETNPNLLRFLDETRAQLDAHYDRIGALLNRRYFTH